MQKLTTLANKLHPIWFSAFLLLLALIPLPFGGNRPWASNLFAIITGGLIALMLWTEHQNISFKGNPPRKRLLIASGGFSIVIFWVFIQAASWTPDSWHHPIWIEAQALLGISKGAISIDTGVFIESLLRLTGYIGCFLLAFVAARNPDHAKRILYTISTAGVIYAIYGLIVHALGAEMILWYNKWAYIGAVTSTFVNKNSYAAYAGLGLIATLSLVRDHFKDKKPKDLILAKKSPLAAMILSLDNKDYVALFLPILFLGVLALTGSRAGVASSLIGVFGFLAAIGLHNHTKGNSRIKHLVGAAVIVFVAVLLFVAVGGQEMKEKLDVNQFSEDSATRLAAYRLSLQAVLDNPWFGFGLGSFESAFRLYRDSSLQAWFHHAHNDYLEMIMDLGFPVALILFGSIALLASCCVSALGKRKRDIQYAAVALGATLLVGTHAFVDFSMHIPAIAATYAALLGTGVAQSWSTKERKKD